LAERIEAFAVQCGGALRVTDLAAHGAEWVEPIGQSFRGYTLHEIPPNGQGVAALIGLGILDRFDIESMGLDSADYNHVAIEAMKLAFADLNQHVADPSAMTAVRAADLLDGAYLADRAALIDMRRASSPLAGTPRSGGTVYLAAADAEGTMVSYIQSNYRGFGSGVVVPGTGISLHNRGEGFSLAAGNPNRVAPGKKPMLTIIPGFITRDGAPVMAMGVMGGSMQAQGHVQMVARLAAFGQNPQAMSDAPPFSRRARSGGQSGGAHTARRGRGAARARAPGVRRRTRQSRFRGGPDDLPWPGRIHCRVEFAQGWASSGLLTALEADRTHC
jgi:gamma-glutamyltranspeptidase/glutathione hydrolase